ncbi:hypothetical protein [Spirosoma aerophilum]
MNALSLRVYQQILAQLNQMSVRSNRHKMTVYVDLNPTQRSVDESSPPETADLEKVVAFHIMFERKNHDSKWQLVTPLRFTD